VIGFLAIRDSMGVKPPAEPSDRGVAAVLERVTVLKSANRT
jgi:hypothetical protein